MIKANKVYISSIITLMLIAPILSIFIDKVFSQSNEGLFALIEKWFVFWAIGLRLMTAGIRQVVNPAFTVEKIFNLKSKESRIVVRELGFANICSGLLGVLSLTYSQFRISAVIVGGLYLGIAGFYHLIKKPDNINEKVAMVSDLFIFIIMIIVLLKH